MFQYLGGDFPEESILDGDKIQWDVQFINEVSLKDNIEKIDVLPEIEEGLIRVVCYLRDGRHFIANVDEETYNQLLVAKGGIRAKKKISKKKMVILCVAVSVIASIVATVVAQYAEEKKAKQVYLSKYRRFR